MAKGEPETLATRHEYQYSSPLPHPPTNDVNSTSTSTALLYNQNEIRPFPPAFETGAFSSGTYTFHSGECMCINLWMGAKWIRDWPQMRHARGLP